MKTGKGFSVCLHEMVWRMGEMKKKTLDRNVTMGRIHHHTCKNQKATAALQQQIRTEKQNETKRTHDVQINSNCV